MAFENDDDDDEICPFGIEVLREVLAEQLAELEEPFISSPDFVPDIVADIKPS